MSAARTQFTLDRYTTIGDLALAVRKLLLKGYIPLLGLCATGVVVLFLTERQGVGAFGLLSAGAFLALHTWTGKATGLPLMPALAAQFLIVYGVPIVTQHDTVVQSSPETLVAAGIELFACLAAMTAAWRFGIQAIRPSPPLAYAIIGIEADGVGAFRRIGFALTIGSTAWLVLLTLQLTSFIFEVLPSGSWPIIGAVTSAASACGFFTLAMIIGSGAARKGERVAFWALFAINLIISASGLLLSGASTVTVAVLIGLVWASGRVPWRFFISMLAILSFFNLGKAEMRDKYWNPQEDEPPPAFSAADLPGRYLEWAELSFSELAGAEKEDKRPAALWSDEVPEVEAQTLLNRVNNLQNLLFVIDAVEVRRVQPLDGATYTLIPPLLLPRILWPNKPRTHAGQILLNVHFGRQSLHSTFTTYIAWGLLPEAYGNFGRITGALVLGLALGLFCAAAEALTARKPVLSLEGLVAFVVFLGFANSYEMVASVMITSIFQSVVPVVLACLPFTHRLVVKRPVAET